MRAVTLESAESERKRACKVQWYGQMLDKQATGYSGYGGRSPNGQNARCTFTGLRQEHLGHLRQSLGP